MENQKLKEIIPVDKGMFSGVPYVVQADGSLARIIDTEILPTMPSINKTKMPSLMPVLDWIAVDWKLNLSKTHDRKVAMRILRNSVKKN